MITEDYVSFETAKLLKEKGFDLSEFHGKWAIDYDNIPRDEDTPEGEIIIAEWHYPLITLQMAMKWLRENHGIHITSVPNGIGGNVFYMSVYRKYDYGWTHISDCFDNEYKEAEFSSPEEACEAAIKYCLENLI